MRVDLVLKNIRKTKVLGEVIEKDIEKIENHLQSFTDVPLHLELRLERSVHKKEYELWMGLYLPKKVLRVHEHAEDKLTCVNSAAKSMIRQIEKVKTQWNRSSSKHKLSIAEVAANSIEETFEGSSEGIEVVEEV